MEREKSFKERRKYARLKTEVEVKYKIIGKPGEVEVFSRDISAGGLCIAVKEQLVIDTPLQLEIKIPDLKEAIRALARVVWQIKRETEGAQTYFETGLEFTGISDFDRFNVNRYVSERIEPKNS